MTRSKWKNIFYENTQNEKRVLRSSKVLPIFLNKSFEVHDGCTWHSITINTNMIGHKFGEFVNTRKKHIFKKKKKKK